MKEYIYKGRVEVAVNGVGVVRPGERILTDFPINHPHFEEVKKGKGKRK